MNQNQKCGTLPIVPLRKLFSFFLFLSSFFLFSIQSSFAQYQNTQKAVTANVTTTIQGYYESLPVDYASNPTKKYPLLIFLHGVGELGNGTTQLPLVLKNAIPKLLNQGIFPASFTVGGEKFSFIVISPQFTATTGQQEAIDAMINYCIQRYRVDVSRIYLTGLSLGGKRSWDYPAYDKVKASRPAAIVPVCSGATGTTSGIANVVGANLPMWFLNNSDDPYISATKALELVNTINATSISPKAKITIHQASGHDAWTKSYDPNFRVNQMNVYEWMLSYKKGTAPAPSPAPALPIANAGSNKVITLPTNSVTLDGSQSTSGGTIVSYAWSKVSGSTATITSPGSVKTTVTGLVAGTYQFKLTVKDSYGATASATVTVTVNAATSTVPLYSDAGSDQTITLPVSSVKISGSAGSTAPSGSTHTWSQTAGPVKAVIASPWSIGTDVTGLTTAGTYQFTLVLKDTYGNTSTSSMYVYVKAATSTVPLYSDAGSNQTITLPVSSVKISGSSGSTAPSGSTHTWSQTAGPVKAVIAAPWSIGTDVTGLTTAGTYQFTLVLKDKYGNTSTSSMYVYVKAATSTVPLYSDAGSNQTITLPVSSVKISGSSGSTAPSGSTHTWSQTAGPVKAVIAAPWSIGTDVTGLTTAGTYQFTLVLKDKYGNTSTSSMYVYVKAAITSTSTDVLYANAGSNQTIILPVTKSLLDGRKSTAPVGSTHIWKQLSGPSKANILYPYSIATDVTGLNVVGDYKFYITITDPKGNVQISYTHVFVESAVSARTSQGVGAVEPVDPLQMANPDQLPVAGELDVKINPNPVKSDMTVWVSGRATGRTSLIVYSLTGQVLLQQEFVKDTPGMVNKTFNVSKLAAGTYVAQIIVDNKYKKAIKILKQ